MVKYQEGRGEEELNTLFHALSDPTRREILSLLLSRRRTVGEIAHAFRSSLPAISKHIKILETARLVVRHKEGRCHVLRLTPAPLTALLRSVNRYVTLEGKKG